MAKFKEIGENALNAADFERTMHLPVGRGRLACDPETGEFDKGAPRPAYNSDNQPEFPRHVHSTITEGEYKVVSNKEEYDDALATRKWQHWPLERKKRFTLTEADQLMSMKGELTAERAARLDLEKRIEVGAFGASPDSRENASLLAAELQQEREARKALEDRVNALLARLEPTSEDELVSVGGKSRKK
jgi:hypothetical protein